MKERIARARQALPNGFCGLPLVQTCPHPNACLSCDNFLTDASFRSVHVQQLAHTKELRERAEQQGSLRLVEVLERDQQSLTRILEAMLFVGAAPLTVMVSSRDPTRRSAFTVAVKFPESSMPSRLTVLKPGSVKVTV